MAITSYVNFPSGCKVKYSTDGTTYTDLGMLIGDTTATWNYDVNVIRGSEGEKLEQYKNQTVAASFDLANLDPTKLSGLAGGLLTQSTTTTTPVTTMPDQVISSGDWAEDTPVNLVLYTSSSDNTKLIASAAPTLTSVTGSVDGALVAGTDYEIIVDSSAYSGFSIVLLAAITTVAQNITIDYASVTPVATTTLTAGHSTYTPSSIGLQLYSEAQGKTFTMYNVNIDSGSFNFGFKASESDGADVMTLSFTGSEDVTRTNGDRLFSIVSTT